MLTATEKGGDPVTWTDEMLNERFDRIDERFDRVDEQFVDTNRRIGELAKETSRRFGEVERRLDKQDETIERRFGEVERRFDKQDETIAELRRGIWSLQRAAFGGSIVLAAGLIGVIGAIVANGLS